MESREKIVELIINHCQGATDNIADKVYYNDLADELWEVIKDYKERYESLLHSYKTNSKDYQDMVIDKQKQIETLQEELKFISDISNNREVALGKSEVKIFELEEENTRLKGVINEAFEASRETIDCKALTDSSYQNSEGGCSCKDGCSELKYDSIEEWVLTKNIKL